MTIRLLPALLALSALGCAEAPGGAPPPVVVAPIASSVSSGAAPSAAPAAREHWVAAENAAALKLVRPFAPTAYTVAARVDLDEHGRAPASLDEVAVVAEHVPAGVALGDRGHFKVETIPSVVFEGKITWIASDRTQLRMALQNHAHTLRPQMAGDLDIDHDGVPGLTVPRAAISPGGTVLVAEGRGQDGRARFVETPVTIAFDGGASWVTVTGLTPALEIAADARRIP